MRTTLKRALTIVAAQTLALAMVATGTSTATAGVRQAAGSPQPLLLWEPATEVTAVAPMLTAFQAKTGIKVNTLVFPSNGFENDLLTKWAAGNRPDIMLWHAIGNWLVAINPTVNLQDMSTMPFVKKTPASVLDNSVRYDGKVWAALLDVPQLDVISYNEKVFDKVGLKVPSDYNQLLSACQAIKAKDPGVSPIVMGGGDIWPVQIPAFMMFNSALKANYGLISGINDNKVHFTDTPFLRGFEVMQTLQKDGCFNSDDLSMTYAQSVDALMTGKGAMEFSVGPAALYPTYTLAQINSTEKVTSLSYSNNVGSWQEAGTGFYLPKTGSSQRESESKQFIDFITGPYYQTYLNTQKEEPLLTGYAAPPGIPMPYVEAYQILTHNSVPQYQQDLQANYSNLFANWIIAMLGGKMTPLQVAQNLQNSFAQNAQQVGLKGF
jgi:raffinose/stachyose/melibiose transport system substrate-binding protein